MCENRQSQQQHARLRVLSNTASQMHRASHFSKHFCVQSLVSPPKEGKPFIPIWEMGKQNPTEVKFFAQGHRASGCRDGGQIQGSWLSSMGVLSLMLWSAHTTAGNDRGGAMEPRSPLNEQEPLPLSLCSCPFPLRWPVNSKEIGLNGETPVRVVGKTEHFLFHFLKCH